MNARRRTPKRKGYPENLYDNNDGYFWYRNPLNGKTKGLGRNRAEAFEEARKANRALDALRKSSLANWVSGNEDMSLADWIPEYKKTWQERENPAPATLTAANNYLKYIAKAKFAWMGLRDITTQHISDYLEEVEKSRGPNIAVHIRTRLSDIFRTAATKGLVSKKGNPVSITYVPKTTIKRDRLSLEQFIAIRQIAPTWLVNAMNLALLTGQRREDITEMMFEDAKDGYLYIVQGKSRGTTKLRIDSRIRLSAVDLSIDDVIKKCRDLVVSKYLVHHSKTEKQYKAGDKLTAHGITMAFSRIRDKAGIEYGDGRTPPTFHEIRSLAERLYREEYGAEFAQSILGHKNAKTTATYDDLRGSGWQEISAK